MLFVRTSCGEHEHGKVNFKTVSLFYNQQSNIFRIFKAEFLQISTATKLYVFDLRLLATRLFDDLRPILENQAYLKIIFDSRLILDNLNTHYKLKIAPVCDLIVVFSIDRNTVFRDLSHCIQEVFGLDCSLEQKVIIRDFLNSKKIK